MQYNENDPYLVQYEGEIANYAECLYEGGHSGDEAMAIAWGTAKFLADLGVI